VSSYIAQPWDASDPVVKTSDIQSAVEALQIDILTFDDQSLHQPSEVLVSGGDLLIDGASLVRTSAMQAALTAKQDTTAFLTTLVSIGGTSGSGNLARVTSPTFVTPVLGAATGTTLVLSGMLDLRPASTANIIQFGTNGFLRSDTSQLTLYNAGTAANAISFNRNGASLNLASTYSVSWGATTQADSGTVDTGLSRSAAGIVSIDTTTRANALGSLACANVTASGTVRLGTYTVATLPSAASNTRALAFVTDSNLAFNSTNLGSTVTAGGSTLVPVLSNGTNWVIG